MKRIFFALTLGLAIGMISCKKDPVEEEHNHDHGSTNQVGKVSLEFENMVGDSALVFSTKQYTNQNNDTFTVTLFNYYISNIKLTGVDNSVYTETESYHLIKSADLASLKFDLSNVPAKHYNSITFTIGVDSTRNCSGAQAGALDPTNGMFWSWSTGYIFAKLEGVSPQSTGTGNTFMHHIGGYTGANKGMRTVTLSLPSHAEVTSSHTPEIHMKADILEWFKTPTTVSINSISIIHMPGVNSKTIADNYADMISVEHVHN